MRGPEELDQATGRFGLAAVRVLTVRLRLSVPEAAAVSLRWGLAGLHTVERFHPADLEAVLLFAEAGMEPWRVVRMGR